MFSKVGIGKKDIKGGWSYRGNVFRIGCFKPANYIQLSQLRFVEVYLKSVFFKGKDH